MSQRRDKALFNSEKEQDRRWKITQVRKKNILYVGTLANGSLNFRPYVL